MSYIQVDTLALFSIKVKILDISKIILEQQYLYVLSFLRMDNLLGTTLPNLRLIARPGPETLAKAKGNYYQSALLLKSLVFKISCDS